MDQKIDELVSKIQRHETILKKVSERILKIHEELQSSMRCLQKSFQIMCNAQYNLREELSEYAGTVVQSDCDTNLF
jgi:hypothetical protein